jgi:hypothetical protein
MSAREEHVFAWTREIDRRLESYERGEVDAVDARVAIEEMRRESVERRSRNVRKATGDANNSI